MKSQEKIPTKLTLSEWQAQEWRCVQPYGTRFMAAFFGANLLTALCFWLDLPRFVCFGVAIPLYIVASRNAEKSSEIRKRRDAAQKAAIEQRWKEEDEQLYQQHK